MVDEEDELVVDVGAVDLREVVGLTSVCAKDREEEDDDVRLLAAKEDEDEDDDADDDDGIIWLLFILEDGVAGVVSSFALRFLPREGVWVVNEGT